MWIAVWKRWCESRAHAEYKAGCQTVCGSRKAGPMPPGLPTNRTEPGSGGPDIAWSDYVRGG